VGDVNCRVNSVHDVGAVVEFYFDNWLNTHTSPVAFQPSAWGIIHVRGLSQKHGSGGDNCLAEGPFDSKSNAEAATPAVKTRNITQTTIPPVEGFTGDA
jgi:hypothetical protein